MKKNRLSFLFAMLALALTAKIAQKVNRVPPPTAAPVLTLEQACASPTTDELKKSCLEYREAIQILHGDRGFDPVQGIRSFTNFSLRPAKGGPMVHDSIRQALCLNCVCRADAGSYSVIGFSGDRSQALMERMSDSDAAGVCDKGTRFFIPVEWLRPVAQKVTQK